MKYNLIYRVGKDRYCKIFNSYEEAEDFVKTKTSAYMWDIIPCPIYFPAVS